MKKKLLLNRLPGLGSLILLMMFGVMSAQNRSLNTTNSEKGQQINEASSSNLKLEPVANIQQGNPLEAMKGKPEDLSKRTVNSKHFKNADGSFTSIISAGAMHYEKNGKWNDINTSIVNSGKANYKFVNLTNLMESHFGTNSAEGLLSISKEGTVKEFLNKKMYWEVAGKAINLQEAANVVGTVKEDKIYYHDLFGKIGAEFTVNIGQRKLNYIIPDQSALGTVPAGAEYLVFEEEIILPKGWTYKSDEKRGIILIDETGKSIYQYQNPISTDANSELNNEINTLYETFLNGENLIIKTKVKTSWLFDQKRQFPVMVDPTLSYYPNALTHRTAQLLQSGAGAYGNFAVGYNGGFYRSYASFDITGIPDSSTINTVVLYHNVGASTGMTSPFGSEIRAFLTDPESAAYPNWIDVYNAITNTTVSPTLYTTVTNLNTTGSKNVTLGATANTHLQNALISNKFTVGYRPAGSYTTTPARYAQFYGESDATRKPYISVTYTEPTTPPSCATILSPTNGATGTAHQGTISWNTSPGATGYDVYFGTSTNPPSVSTNQTATTYTLPNCLSPLTTYYWRVVPRNANGSSTGCATWSFTTDNKLHIYKNDWETATLGYFGTSGTSVDGWYTNNNSGTGGSPTLGYNNTWTVGDGVYAISSKSVGVSALNNGGLAGSYFDYYDDLGEIHRWIYRPFNMTGLRDIDVTFRWKSGGTLDKKYGSVISSINNGANWLMDTQGGLTNDGKYWNSPTTIRTQTVALPSTRNNQPNFQLGFKWDDIGDYSVGIVPSFVVDDIVVKACPYEGTINSTAVSAGVYEWNPTGNTQTTLSIVGTYQCAQFQWEQSINGGATWINAIGGSGSTTISYTTPNNLTIDTWYRCKVYFSTGCLGAYQLESFKILFCEKTWSGTTTNWANQNNWTPTGIPTANHCVKIPSIAFKPTIQVGTHALAKNLTVEFGGQLNIKGNLTVTDFIENSGDETDLVVDSDANLVQVNAATNIGNITLKRDSKMKRLDYIYWGSPVNGQNFISFSPLTVVSRFYRYNEQYDSFHTISNLNDLMDAGEGYAIRAPNNQNATTPTTWTGIFVGKPNNGGITIPVTKHPDSPIDPNNSSPLISRGKNMLANPYPSNLDLEALTTANPATATGVYYFWTNTPDFVNNTQVPGNGTYGNYGSNHYATYSSSGAVPAANTNSQLPSRHIRPGQGFLFEAKAGGTVAFNNLMRSTNDNSTFISNKVTENSPERFWLKLTTPINNTNTLLIAYIPGATNLFDTRYDAKFPQKSSDRFYSIIDDKELVIQGRQYPFSASDVVKLGMAHFVAGNYKIEIADIEGIFNNRQNIYLKDKQTGIVTNLSQASYTYAAEAGEQNARFEIIYQPETVLGTDENIKNSYIVYRDVSDFVVKSTAQTIEYMELYDAAGRLVLQVKGNNSKELRFSSEKLHQGMYVLKVITKDGVITKKIINY